MESWPRQVVGGFNKCCIGIYFEGSLEKAKEMVVMSTLCLLALK